MDFFVLAFVFFVCSVVVAFVLFSAFRIFSVRPRRNVASVRGALGEHLVSSVIGNTVEGEQYVMNDVVLSVGDHSSQIDHIVINPRGIFVVETKNYSGRIYGSDKDKYWTQVLGYGRSRYRFYSPVLQNNMHVCRVKNIVGSMPVHSLVVFTQNNTQFISAKNVVSLFDLPSVLADGENVLSPLMMKYAYNLLCVNRSSMTSEEHVQQLESQREKIDRGICPWCNGALVWKRGKYGDFVSCSNYPKCRFTKK